MMESPSEARERRKELWKSALFRWLVLAQLLVLFCVAYVKMGGLLVSQTNHTTKAMFGGDQMHNMRMATWAREDLTPDFSQGFTKALMNFFPHNTDGVVQPLWPWVAAWMTEPDHEITEERMVARLPTDADVRLFVRGKWFNIFMTATFLVLLGVAAARIFTFPAACNLVLLGGFAALLPRAVYFQPEPLFFIFFFLTWVACICALKHNSLWIHAVVGVLGGLAYLTKGSVQPLLVVFVAVGTLRCLGELFTARRGGQVPAENHQWHWRNHVVGVIMLAVSFLMTAGPRLTDSYEKFGNMFHSYPSYWMWMDSFETEGYEWMGRHNTREALTSLRAEDKPSMRNYLRTHTTEEVRTRLMSGTRAKMSEFLWPRQTERHAKIERQKPWRGVLEWRGIYLAATAGMLLLMVGVLFTAAPAAEHVGQKVFRPGTLSVILFVGGSFALYALAYGWYHPIGRGDRFMMSLYLPLAFSFIWGAESILRRIRKRQGSVWITRSYLTLQWLLFAAICWRLYEIFRVPLFYSS